MRGPPKSAGSGGRFSKNWALFRIFWRKRHSVRTLGCDVTSDADKKDAEIWRRLRTKLRRKCHLPPLSAANCRICRRSGLRPDAQPPEVERIWRIFF